jgi:hypothetical protein
MPLKLTKEMKDKLDRLTATPLAKFYEEVAKIPKLEKEYISANNINLTVGKIESDGDWGHGGRSYIKLRCEGAAAMILVTDCKGEEYFFDIGEWASLEILAGGETERQTISEAMADVGKYLKNGVREI